MIFRIKSGNFVQIRTRPYGRRSMDSRTVLVEVFSIMSSSSYQSFLISIRVILALFGREDKTLRDLPGVKCRFTPGFLTPR